MAILDFIWWFSGMHDNANSWDDWLALAGNWTQMVSLFHYLSDNFWIDKILIFHKHLGNISDDFLGMHYQYVIGIQTYLRTQHYNANTYRFSHHSYPILQWSSFIQEWNYQWLYEFYMSIIYCWINPHFT